jgi:hypothetical protein
MTDERYAAATRRVDQLAGFAIHVLAFLVVNAVLFSQTGFRPEAGHFWGWGIGLAAHAAVVLGPGSRIRPRLIEQQLERPLDPSEPR